MKNDQGQIEEFLMTIRKLLQLNNIEYVDKIVNQLIGYP